MNITKFCYTVKVIIFAYKNCPLALLCIRLSGGLLNNDITLFFSIGTGSLTLSLLCIQSCTRSHIGVLVGQHGDRFRIQAPLAYLGGGAKGPWPPPKAKMGGPKYHMAPPKSERKCTKSLNFNQKLPKNLRAFGANHNFQLIMHQIRGKTWF